MPLTKAEIMAKVRRHKFGRRKLATTTALAAYNRAARKAHLGTAKEKAQFLPTMQAIASDVGVLEAIRNMNLAFKTMLRYFGRTDVANDVIVLRAPDEMFIPLSVWLGRFHIPRGTLTAADAQIVDDQEAIFSDNAGNLRHHIAKILATQAVMNDVGNVNAAPNPGGAGGEKAFKV